MLITNALFRLQLENDRAQRAEPEGRVVLCRCVELRKEQHLRFLEHFFSWLVLEEIKESNNNALTPGA